MASNLAVIGYDVGGRVLNLAQLEIELRTGGVAVPYGLTYAGLGAMPPWPGDPVDPKLPPGTLLFTHDSAGQPTELPAAAKPIVDAHVPQ